MTWPVVVLVLGLVWWVPAVVYISVLVNRQKSREMEAANLKIAQQLLDTVKAL